MSGGGGATGAAISARAFCGDGYPWPLIRDLADGAEVAACYLVLECRRLETKQNKPYLRLVLGDSTGSIDAMVWEDAERLEAVCAPEAFVGVRARVGSYQDRLQLKVVSVQAVSLESGDYELLLPASPRPREAMDRELAAIVASVRDPGLSALLRRTLGRNTETGRAYRTHPAAKRNHHAYVAGLLEHSLSVAASCARLAEHYAEQGVAVDRDLLVTAALLHDIGKLRELKGFPANAYTTEGKLLGHIVIGIQMVAREAEAIPEIAEERRLLLLHLIASHQGRPEWDSPRVPQVIEALILHYADDLDAKVNQAGSLVAGVDAGEWTSYDRSLERSFFRHASAGDPVAAAGGRDEPEQRRDPGHDTLDMFSA